MVKNSSLFGCFYCSSTSWLSQLVFRELANTKTENRKDPKSKLFMNSQKMAKQSPSQIFIKLFKTKLFLNQLYNFILSFFMISVKTNFY